MAKTLVIVESPSKARTIGKYLGSSYKVTASVGHIRDLPKSKIGIDIDNDFEPQYISIRGKGDIIKQLKKDAKSADRVYLATDPDREGEAISWHLCHILGIDPSDNIRVTFNEITKEKVKEAMKNPRPIDLKLVDAQQARRVLDRLVGYKISPILWKKVRRGLSAGRVQSAALKLICDREQQILDFIPKEYWNITVDFEDKKSFSGKVTEFKGEKFVCSSEKEADIAKTALSGGEYIVDSVAQKERSRKPFPPFTTSSMQQEAANKAGFTTKKTMSVAQRLYEGVDIPGHGTIGLITYMRTDSVRISDDARAAAYSYIMNTQYLGKEYTAYNVYSNKKKDIQDAHEAIRPTNVFLTPEDVKDSLDKDQYNLYSLIWSRFVASQMSAAVFDTTQINVKNGDYLIRVNGSKRKFDGYQKIYSPNFDEDKDSYVPEVKQGDKLKAKDINAEQKFTEPPARFTEASLVKELEEKNIGRPSTYAPIIATLLERKYISRLGRSKSIQPTELGKIVTNLIVKYFVEIADVEFTSNMEDKLDDIEAKNTDWKDIIREFYKPFEKELETAEKEIEHIVIEDKPATDDEGNEIFCEKCGNPMLIKSGRFGEFMACSNYPECKNTKPIVKAIGVKCPDCGGDVVAKRGKSGKIFYGCSNYPECNKAFWYKPSKKTCPKCGNILLEKHLKYTKLVCSDVKCDYKE